MLEIRHPWKPSIRGTSWLGYGIWLIKNGLSKGAMWRGPRNSSILAMLGPKDISFRPDDNGGRSRRDGLLRSALVSEGDRCRGPCGEGGMCERGDPGEESVPSSNLGVASVVARVVGEM